ncbi:MULTISPECIES: ANTAR domain-containing protein [Streptomyces]|uniref:ANTAR domain-containing protein n=1 Tax=Streptomyces TaxID=1883 RepID=UPI002248C5B3|nr:ANTAR domain-containing protein [Streptomyces sp. JHD 1]MCX2970791.1 ANTAR domain-containing protein [Streptomyces sp. JHD 1]
MSSETVGTFRYHVADDTWTWSEAMYRLYGYEPGGCTPTTALLTDRVPTADRERLLSVFAGALRGGDAPTSELHQITTPCRTRTVVTLVERATPPGEPPELHGYTVDVSVPVRRVAARLADRDVRAAVDGHRLVDQAIGVLTLLHGVERDAGFGLLRWLSQQSNTKLRTVAGRIVDAARQSVRVPPDTALALDAALSDAALADAVRADGVPDGAVPADGVRLDGARPDGVRPGGADGASAPGGAAGSAAGARASADGVHEPLRIAVDSGVTEEGEPAAVLRARGAVNLVTTPDFAQALRGLMGAQHRGAHLCVDLSDVAHLTSAALAELHRFRHQAERRGRSVTVRPPAHLPAPARRHQPQ